jgi:hypothetical protein
LISIFIFTFQLFALPESFSLIKKGVQSSDHNNTLLIIAGIQGDEAGGYMAANMLANRYEVDEGEVWIVPNLNYKSIVENSRGVHGDMNRKFKDVDKSDPDYEAVERIKSIILDDKVDVILHLHDGSGFYRKEYIDASLNPQRWGQSSIIDTKKVESAKHGELEEIAQKVADSVNEHLLEDEHKFHVKNTNTPLGKTFEQKEMLKTLTYFTIENNKAAFANEASKNLPLETRVYYHLRAIESYMDFLGIRFKREFELTPANIYENFYKDIDININNKKIVFPTENIRNFLSYVPLKKGENNTTSQTPLIIGKKEHGFYDIYYGSDRIVRLKPQYFEYDDSLKGIDVVVDGKEKTFTSGDIVEIDEYVRIKELEGYRVNVIGYIKDRSDLKASEDEVDIYREDFLERFSIDTKSRLFRAEIYKDGKYCGMLILKYR